MVRFLKKKLIHSLSFCFLVPHRCNLPELEAFHQIHLILLSNPRRFRFPSIFLRGVNRVVEMAVLVVPDGRADVRPSKRRVLLVVF